MIIWRRYILPSDYVLLLHDNARLHTSIRTRETIASFGWTTLLHPPCLPDLSQRTSFILTYDISSCVSNYCWTKEKDITFLLILVYSLLMSSLECEVLCIAINFPVLWSLCLSFSLVHFKNCSDYLTRNTVQVFILLIKFLQQILVSRSFLIFLRYFFFHL